MKKELSKTNNQISEVGKVILNSIQKNWRRVEGVIERTELVEDESGAKYPKIVKRRVKVDSQLMRLNKGVTISDFAEFVGMVQPEDKDRILTMIEKGYFELVQAKRSFRALSVVTDKSIRPVTWEDAEKIDSPTLVTLRNYKGLQYATDLVYSMLFSFAKKFGKKSDLDEVMLMELAEDIVFEFNNKLTVADIKMILANALRASDKVFNLDYQTIFSLFDREARDKDLFMVRRAEDHHIFEVTSDEKSYREKPAPAGPTAEGMSLKDQLKEIAIFDKNHEAEKQIKRAAKKIMNQKPDKK